jgi:DNA polymerase-3 subunit gamma/tau
MDYVVLARKLRPQRFQDLVGQELAARALRNAIRTGRLAHAYLFAGSRGIGKTSTARILTKAFNCLDIQDGEPCNACENCREISANASPDVFEIDAASNRGIDNIRELRENTGYAPAKCKYKTYIIDEVHMLTTESFNALLKTLEEPPPHVKFILATTHPHRVPETILSRCQRFDFARIPPRRMADYLEQATAAEGLTLSRAALESIARNAAGGMRDALTMVDQAVAFAGPQPSDADVLGLLGLLDHEEVQALLGAVLTQALPEALAGFERLVTRGNELPQILDVLLREVKDLTLYSTLGGDSPYFADHLPRTLEFFSRHRDAATLDQLQQVFHILLDLEGQMRNSGQARACFEMALVKASRVQPLVGVPELLARAREALRGGGGASSGGTSGRSATAARPAPTAVRSVPRPPAVEPPPPPPVRTSTASNPAPARRPVPGREETRSEAPEEPEPAQATPRGEASPGTGSPVLGSREPASAEAPATPKSSLETLSGTGDAQPGALEAVPHTATEPGDGDTPDVAAPCDDPRWVALVQTLAERNRLLAGHVRHAEVRAITEDTVELTTAGRQLNPQDSAGIEADVQRIFGPAFRLKWIDGTSGSYRARRSLTGRRQWREEAAMAQERAQAEADPAVTQVRRFFPDSKIVRVDLATKAPPGRLPEPGQG